MCGLGMTTFRGVLQLKMFCGKNLNKGLILKTASYHMSCRYVQSRHKTKSSLKQKSPNHMQWSQWGQVITFFDALIFLIRPNKLLLQCIKRLKFSARENMPVSTTKFSRNTKGKFSTSCLVAFCSRINQHTLQSAHDKIS